MKSMLSNKRNKKETKGNFLDVKLYERLYYER